MFMVYTVSDSTQDNPSAIAVRRHWDG